MVTGRGGWPMTVIMTPDKKPFFAGTYFPKESRKGQPGMLQLIPSISNAWENKQNEILINNTSVLLSIYSSHFTEWCD